MYAHYYATKFQKILILSETVRPTGQAISVKNKAEARKIAKENNATCWNF